MIDHICVDASNYKASKMFYEKALKPLGIKLLKEYEEKYAGYGSSDKPFFWVIGERSVTKHSHFAFATERRELVNAFYDAAISADGKDNGKPGIREHYHPNYYGAFVLDPDGNNVEAVCHRPE